jgi:hypothetical protein
MQETFWWDDPKSLVTVDNWKQFVPRGPFNVHYLNSIARFILYLGIAAWLFYRRQEIIFMTLFGLLVTVLIYKKKFSPAATSGAATTNRIAPTTTNSTATTTSTSSATKISDTDTAHNANSNACLVDRTHNPQLINSTTCQRLVAPSSLVDKRFEIPEELFDGNLNNKTELKTINEDKLFSKSIETNGLPNDNQPNMGVIPTLDLRPGTVGQKESFDESGSAFLSTLVCEAKGNNLTCEPAPVISVMQDAFKMGDRLGDNIRRDPNIHSSSIDTVRTPNNKVCGPCQYNPRKDYANPGAPQEYDRFCQMATPNNPFGNVLPTDNVANPGKYPSCLDRDDTDNKWTLAASTAAAATGSLASGGQGLFRNTDDVWDRNNSQMVFNTLPSTTIPNDRDSFQKWLFHIPYVCKDGDMEVCYGIDEMQTRKAGQILAP